MIVVADTGPISYLVLIGADEVLFSLYKRVIIPQAVADELGDLRAPIKIRGWIAKPPSWLETVPDPPSDGSLNALDPGERSAIGLATVMNAVRLLIDDSDGRAEATRRQLKVIGTLGILAAGHHRRLLDFEEAINALLSTNFYISPHLLAATRRLLMR